MHSAATTQELQIQQRQHAPVQELVQEEHDQHMIMITKVLAEEEAAPHEIVLLDWDQVDHSRSAASHTTKR